MYTGKFTLGDCVSKVITTEKFTEEYMDVFKKHVRYAHLFQEIDRKKVKVIIYKSTEKKEEFMYVVETCMKIFGKIIKKKHVVYMPKIAIPSVKLKKNESITCFYIVRNHKDYFRSLAA